MVTGRRAAVAGWARVVLGLASFHLALAVPDLRALVVLHCAGLWWLGSHHRPGSAFVYGVLYGIASYAPQLWWMVGIFGWFASILWMILAAWFGYYAFALAAVRRWFELSPRLLVPLAALAFVGMEFTRGEINPLRFTWLNTGYVLGVHGLLPWLGSYGMSGLVMFTAAAAWSPGRLRWLGVALIPVVVFGLLLPLPATAVDSAAGPRVVGIQLEFPSAAQVVDHLDAAYREHPGTELFILSEYTFRGAVSQSVRSWVDDHDVYLVVGGVDRTPAGKLNTAFVVGPDGAIVHRQVKAQPIQFFDDGLPATRQECWVSPWGRLGLAVCYDLSYTRYIDQLIGDDARALIIPTMDVIDWGQVEHEQHARIAPLRAAEYAVPIVRVCSSGISQLVAADGRVLQSAPFPGQGARLVGRLPLASTARPAAVPPLRQVARLLGYGFILGVLTLLILALRRRGRPSDQAS